MMLTISVLNLKGGVGKTAASVNLAAGAMERGRRVLLVDLDPQASATDHLVNDEPPRPSAASLLVGDHQLSDIRGIVRTPILDARSPGELFLVPSGGFELSAAEVALQARGSKNRLRRVLNGHPGSRFELIFVDTGPGLDFLWYNALYASDIVLVPVELQMPAIQGLGRVHELISFAREEDGLDPAIYYVPSNDDGRVRESRDLLAVLYEQYGEYPGGTVFPSIRYSSALSKAYGQRQTIFEFARTDRAALDCLRIVDILNTIARESEIN